MKTTKLLLPNGVKKVGWWMIAIGIVLSLVYGIAPDGALCESWNDFRVLFGLERLPVTMDGFSGFSPESNLVNTLIGVLLVAICVWIQVHLLVWISVSATLQL